MWKAYCYRKGIIGFGAEVPDGAFLIASAERGLLEQVVQRLASSTISPGRLVAETVFEALNAEEALEAVMDFRDKVQRALAEAAFESVEA